ncbi:beta-parvin [Alexandromys fortis]|uniref:beta-parvin n=1 Tax=Alexandromys fortis TaxID=100897 RepID=UPI002153295E|nr:beta-parvin [Microtus fortis]
MSSAPPRSPTPRAPKMKKDESFLGKLGGTLARKKKTREVTDLQEEGKSAINSPMAPALMDIHPEDTQLEENEERTMIDPTSREDPKFKELIKVLLDWINDVLAEERIIVKQLEEDLYDGQVLQKLLGERQDPTAWHHPPCPGNSPKLGLYLLGGPSCGFFAILSLWFLCWPVCTQPWGCSRSWKLGAERGQEHGSPGPRKTPVAELCGNLSGVHDLSDSVADGSFASRAKDMKIKRTWLSGGLEPTRKNRGKPGRSRQKPSEASLSEVLSSSPRGLLETRPRDGPLFSTASDPRPLFLPPPPKAIHGKNLVSILHLLVSLAMHFRAPIHLPEHVTVQVVVVRKREGLLHSSHVSEELTTTTEIMMGRFERDAFDTLFDHAPDKLNLVKKSLITFVNKHLNKLNLEVTDLETQFADGVYLVLLLGLLEDYFVPLHNFYLTPDSFDQKVHNVAFAFELMLDGGLKKPKARPEDVVNLDLKSTLRVLYTLFTKYKDVE